MLFLFIMYNVFSFKKCSPYFRFYECFGTQKKGTALAAPFFIDIQLNGMNLVLCICVSIYAVLFVLSVLEELERNLLEECI